MPRPCLWISLNISRVMSMDIFVFFEQKRKERNMEESEHENEVGLFFSPW